MNTAAPARLIVILGPTASGKSALAIELAKRLNPEASWRLALAAEALEES